MVSPTHEWPNVLRSFTENQGLPRTVAVEYAVLQETLRCVIRATGMLKRSSQDAAVERMSKFSSVSSRILRSICWLLGGANDQSLFGAHATPLSPGHGNILLP